MYLVKNQLVTSMINEVLINVVFIRCNHNVNKVTNLVIRGEENYVKT